MSRGFLNLLSHLVIAIEIEDIGDEIESVLVILDVGVEACQVEAVGEVVLIDFAEVFISAR